MDPGGPTVAILQAVDRGVVLITGCSSGIGRATAMALAAAGYTVVATARRPEAIEGLGVALGLPLDVTDDASIGAAVDATLERFGRIDVLVNNAGIAVRGSVEDVEVDAVQRMFDVNVHGVIRMVRAVAPVMRRQRSGRIVTIGSIGGRLANPANGTYAATKHAVEALSDAMRVELGMFGIDVVLIEPGNIRTSFDATAGRVSGTTLARRDSPYAPLYRGYSAATARLRAHEPGPEAVARVVLDALAARRPRARYRAAVPLATRVMIALPDAGRDALMRRLYRVGHPGRRCGASRDQR